MSCPSSPVASRCDASGPRRTHREVVEEKVAAAPPVEQMDLSEAAIESVTGEKVPSEAAPVAQHGRVRSGRLWLMR